MTKLVIMLPSVDDKTGYNVTFMQQMTKLVLMLFIAINAI